MKKIVSICLFVCVWLFACTALVACKDGPEQGGDENIVVIEISADVTDAENVTLKAYMDRLQSEGALSYTIRDGMVTVLNGKANAGKSYWMLYTDDSANANAAWGTLEYGGKTYGSAVLGAETLTIKGGCVYIWAYQTF